MSAIPNETPIAAPSQDSDGVDARRIARGQRIAASTSIVQTKDGWQVPSDSRRDVYYRVWVDENGAHCSCPDTFRTCKHILALQIKLNGDRQTKAIPALAWTPTSSTVERQIPESEPVITMPAPEEPAATPRQPIDWRAYHRAQTNEGWLFPQLLHALCALVSEPANSRTGRPRVPVRDLLFGEVYREYCDLSSRRCHTNIEDIAMDGWISRSYSPNAGTKFLNQPETTDLLRALIAESARPLRSIERTFAPDSSGFSTCTHGRWHDEKHGSVKTGATYVKTHIMVGVQTHIITAASASVEPVGDITAFPKLLEETRGAHFTVDELVADSAYRGEAMMEWLDALGIDSWVPFRNNARFHYDGSLWDRHLAVFLLNQDLFVRHYHQRSQVETAFSMIKTKYGAHVRGKTPTSQANNVLCKLLANNLYVLIRSIFDLDLAPEFEKCDALQNVA